jgi:hypothetical protein
MPSPVPPALPLAAATASGAGLRAGQSFNLVVRNDAQGLHLRVASLRLPLPPDSGLHTGQAVQARVQAGPSGLSLLVEPVPAGIPPPSGPAPPAHPAAALLERMLPALAQLRMPPGFERLLPRQLPATEGALRPWITLLLAQDSPGSDLARLALLARDAAAANALPPAWAAAIAAVLVRPEDAKAASLRGLLARLGASKTAEAALAKGLPAFGYNDADLRSLLPKLQAHAPFRTYLRSAGLLGEFEAVAARLMDHAHGSLLQGLRGLDQPYAFLSLPFAPETGLHHAQVHFFPDNEAASQSGVPAHMVVVDCATSRLGDLWVTLRSTGPACQCVFRATGPEACESLTAALPELEAALATAGFGPVAVRVEAVEENRLDALAALARRFGGAAWQA